MATVFASLLALAAGAQVLEINTNDVYPRSSPEGKGFEDRILAEAFRRLGMSYRIVRLPSERALLSADQGLVDGDYVRIAGLEPSYPNLVMVAEPIASMEFTAFALAPSLPIDSWQQLSALELGHINGWKIFEEKTKGFPHLTVVRDEAALFSLLRTGKVDAVLYERLEGERYFRASGGPGGIRAGKTLEKRDMYLYLNVRHAALAPLLAAKLKEMRAEGLIDRIVKEVLSAAGP
jgi:polar amino acid transport system substrate-binding protein